MFISEYDGLQGLGAVDSVYVQKIAWSCAQLFAIFHMEYLLVDCPLSSKLPSCLEDSRWAVECMR